MGWGLDYIQEVGGDIVDGVQSAASATVEGFQHAAGWVHDQLTPDIRPEGVGGHRIYVWFHHGPGTGSLDNAVDGWGKVSEKHTEVGDAVNAAMGKLRTSWEGEASTAARSAGRPLRDAADSASECARQAGSALGAQSFGFNETKKNVVDVPSEPPTINPLAGGLGAVSYYQQAQSYTAEQQANQAALQGYGSQTGSNSGSVPRFGGAPGDVNRDVGVAPSPGAPVGAHFEDPGGTGSASTYSAGSGSSGVDTAGSRGAGYTGDGVRTGGPVYQGTGSGSGGSGGGAAGGSAGTGSAWYDGGEVNGGGFDYSASHGLSGAGVAAGAAGLVAGGGAVLGGGVLGERVGGRGGISGRGIPGFGSRSGSAAGSGSGSGSGGRVSGGTGSGSGARSGSGPLGGGRSGSGVAPTTGSTGTTVASGAARTATGAPMAAGAGGRGQPGEDDEQHERPEWLTAAESPDELFGTDERTAPPVLGALPSEQEHRQ